MVTFLLLDELQQPESGTLESHVAVRWSSSGKVLFVPDARSRVMSLSSLNFVSSTQSID